MCRFQAKDEFSRDYSTSHKLLLFQHCFGKKKFDCLCTIGLGQQRHRERKLERKIETGRHVEKFFEIKQSCQ